METTMIDRNGNIVNSGNTVDIIIAGELQHKAIFKGVKGELATITELGVKFRKGGKQSYNIQSLKKYIYANHPEAGE